MVLPEKFVIRRVILSVTDFFVFLWKEERISGYDYENKRGGKCYRWEHTVSAVSMPW